MKTIVALLALLALAALHVSGHGNSNNTTYVSNESCKPIVATINYQHVNFTDRLIDPHLRDFAEYTCGPSEIANPVRVELWLEELPPIAHRAFVQVACYTSIVLVDGKSKNYSVGIFAAAAGNITKPVGNLLGTL